MLLITIGISGSGKNYLKNQLENKFPIKNIEPDDIRRKKLGDVSNQENGGMIFNIAKNMINSSLKKNEISFFNATNLDWKRIVKFVLELDKPSETSVIFLFMNDSINLEKCKERVLEDLRNGIDRAKVPMEVIEKQHDRYRTCLHNAKNHPEISIKDCPENWKIFEYQNNFEELIYFIEELNGNTSTK
jgi:predicted kinase